MNFISGGWKRTRSKCLSSLLILLLAIAMGKAPAWTSHENEALATAWINTSEDKDSTKVKGTNQTKQTFFASVIEKLETIALESGEDVRSY